MIHTSPSCHITRINKCQSTPAVLRDVLHHFVCKGHCSDGTAGFNWGEVITARGFLSPKQPSQGILFCSLQAACQHAPGMLIHCTEASEKGKGDFSHLPTAEWRCKILLLTKKMGRPWDVTLRKRILHISKSLLVSSAHFHSQTQWKRNLTDRLMDSQNPKPVLFCRPSKIVFKYM